MSKRITIADVAARLDAHIEQQTEHNAAVTAILARLTDTAPAAVTTEVVAPVTAEEDKPFVEWIRETAPARAARKSSNAEMAAWMRSKGVVPNGLAWEAAKKGERNVRTLKALNAKDAKARKA